MDYIEKLELQTEEVKEVETLEKHSIINNDTFSVNKYNGHTRDFLAIDGDYNDGFNQLKEVDGLGISCVVSKEVKEARKDVNGNVHTRLKDRIDTEVNNIKTSLENMVIKVEDFKTNNNTWDEALTDCLEKSKNSNSLKVLFPNYEIILSNFTLYNIENVEFLGMKNTCVKLKNGVIGNAQFDLVSCKNLKFYNLTIDGDRINHDSLKGVYNETNATHGFRISESYNISFDSIYFKNISKDGIYINTYAKVKEYCSKNINIKNCCFDGIERSGVVVINGEKIYVDKCSFKDCKNSYVDIETNLDTDYVRDVSITNSTSDLGKDVGMFFSAVANGKSICKEVKVENCIFHTSETGFGGNTSIENIRIKDTKLICYPIYNKDNFLQFINCNNSIIQNVQIINEGLSECLSQRNNFILLRESSVNLSNVKINSKSDYLCIVSIDLYNTTSEEVSENYIVNIDKLNINHSQKNNFISDMMIYSKFKNLNITNSTINCNLFSKYGVSGSGEINIDKCKIVNASINSVYCFYKKLLLKNCYINNKSLLVKTSDPAINYLISDNTFEKCGIFFSATATGNIYIFGNSINNSYENGIYISHNFTGIAVLEKNNVCNSTGVGLSCDCNNIKIKNNICTDNQAVKTQTYGLGIKNTSKVDICGNDFSGNKTGAIYGNPTSYIPNVTGEFIADIGKYNFL